MPLFSHSTTSLNISNIQELEGHAQFPFCRIDFENLAVVREVQQFYARTISTNGPLELPCTQLDHMRK